MSLEIFYLHLQVFFINHYENYLNSKISEVQIVKIEVIWIWIQDTVAKI